MEFSEKARIPDAKRLFRAYSQSASTLNLIRAFSQGGFADLRQVHLWNLGYIKNSAQTKKFKHPTGWTFHNHEFVGAKMVF